MQSSQEDKIISEFLSSIGPWGEFVVIGGGFALFIYRLYQADPKIGNNPVGTMDIDSLIPRKVPEISKKNIAMHLQEAGFTHIFKGVDIPATEAYVKEIGGSEVEIEFLTDSATRNDKTRNVSISGVVAQPLRYLTLSLQKSMGFQTYSGKPGRVVSPEAWIFTKGLPLQEERPPQRGLKTSTGFGM